MKERIDGVRGKCGRAWRTRWVLEIEGRMSQCDMGRCGHGRCGIWGRDMGQLGVIRLTWICYGGGHNLLYIFLLVPILL